MPASTRSGKVVTKAILIQCAIVAGLVVWFKLGVPGLQKERNAEEAAKREGRIHDLLQSTIAEDSAGSPPPKDGGAAPATHAQRLLKTPSVDDVKEAMGPADGYTSDVGGGVHIIWTGTQHKLEASFNNGRLYCLRVEDLNTGHGALIFESSAQWHEF